MKKNLRDKEIKEFLPPGAKRTPLAGDASFRRYERISLNGKTLVLMDAPPEKESCLPFVAIARFLTKGGFSAPKILKSDLAKGLLLLEDLGDDRFTRILTKSPGSENALYTAAVEALVNLHRTRPPNILPLEGGKAYPLPEYDDAALYDELFLFPDWYLKEITGESGENSHRELRRIWQPLFDRVTLGNSVLTLKDYHADNLMWLADRKGVEKVGVLDFQDGLLGHPAYDLVSLLQDARRPYNPDLESKMIDLYLKKAGLENRHEFLAAYQILGAQRNAKIIGIFTRLWRRDNKPAYPKMIPHVWTLLEENLKHPVLKDAEPWFDRAVPKPLRQKIPE